MTPQTSGRSGTPVPYPAGTKGLYVCHNVKAFSVQASWCFDGVLWPAVNLWTYRKIEEADGAHRFPLCGAVKDTCPYLHVSILRFISRRTTWCPVECSSTVQ